MPLVAQHLLVIVIVGASAAFVLRQGLMSLKGRKSKLGSCGNCNSCGTPAPAPKAAPVQFLPVEALLKKK